MTRQEQIEKAATAKSRGETPYYYDAFIAGAEWADAHPSISVVSDPKTLDAELGQSAVTKTSDQELEPKKEEFEARVSMAYEGREQWEAFLNRVWSIHTSELPRWISVDDEMPKDGECVATINTVGVKDVRHYSHGKWYSNFGNEYDDITHWMRLPALPEKGGAQ